MMLEYSILHQHLLLPLESPPHARPLNTDELSLNHSLNCVGHV